MTLHFQQFGNEGKPPLVFIHGLFGSGVNWRSVAKEFSTTHTAYVLDLRNHGGSMHSPSMTYLDMASDIQEFVISQGLQDYVLCGHSMGGKAVIVNALMNDLLLDDQLRALVVLDIAPVAYEHSHNSHLDALLQIDLESVESRAAVDKQLQASIPETATRLFLLQSLVREDGAFRWKINIPVLQEYMPDIVGFPTRLVVGKKSNKPALFLHGKESNYVSDKMHQTIAEYFPEAQIQGLPGAGHWLHIDQREAMLAALKVFLC